MNGTRSRHFAQLALRALLDGASTDEDFARAERFAQLNRLDYAAARSGLGAQVVERARQTWPQSTSRSAAALRRELARRSAA